MGAPFRDHFLEQPLALDVAPSGRAAALDRGGRRLCLGGRGEPATFDLDFHAIRCRFHGDTVVLLGNEGELRTLAADGTPIGELRLRPGALNIAVMKSGSLLVSYGRRGMQEHGITVERLGNAPASYEDPALLDATGLAVESGACWVAGTGSADPAARAVRLRPVPGGLKVTRVVPLPVPPRAATIGPDGALFVILEPGEALVRIHGTTVGAMQRLPVPLHELARGKQSLWGCGARGLTDLTHLVPPPDPNVPQLQLPPCSP